MTNADVFSACAAGREAHSNNVRSVIYDPSPLYPEFQPACVLYSYQTPIAFVRGDVLYYDDRRYSNTSSKQRAGMIAAMNFYLIEARPSLSATGRVHSMIRLDHDVFREMLERDHGVPVTGAWWTP